MAVKKWANTDLAILAGAASPYVGIPMTCVGAIGQILLVVKLVIVKSARNAIPTSVRTGPNIII
jgi:sporulation protein YlmC with PRC-barrel domain